MYAAVHRVIDDFVKIDQALHTTLRLWLLRLHTLRLRWGLEHILVLFSMLLQLLVKRADLLHLFLGRCRFQLVDIANEGILFGRLRALVRLTLFDDHLEVAVEEVKPWYVVPGLQGVASEDDDLVAPEEPL